MVFRLNSSYPALEAVLEASGPGDITVTLKSFSTTVATLLMCSAAGHAQSLEGGRLLPLRRQVGSSLAPRVRGL